MNTNVNYIITVKFILVVAFILISHSFNGQISNKKKYYTFELVDLMNINNIKAIPGPGGLNFNYSKEEIKELKSYLHETRKLELEDSLRAIVHNRIANCHIAIDSQWDSALFHYNASSQYLMPNQINLKKNNLIELARGYISRNNWLSAEHAIKQRTQLFCNPVVQDSSLCLACYSQLILCYSQLNEVDSAAKYRSIKNSLGVRPADIFQNLEKVSLMKYSENLEDRIDFQKFKIEAEIEKSTLLEHKKKWQKIVFLSVLTIFTLIGFSVFYKIQSSKRQLEIEIINQKGHYEKLLNSIENKTFDHLVEAQEKERIRISKELHDRIGGMLAMAKVHYKIAEEKLEKFHNQNIEQLKIANEILEKACDETRIISHELAQGEISKFGLIDAVDELVKLIRSTEKYEVEFHHHNINFPISQKNELIIYRIIQELLSNILKHAKANYVSIQITKRENILSLIVEDNGIGFDTNLAESGLGLKSIKQRTLELGGEIFIDTGHNHGSIFSIEFNTLKW